VFVLFCAEKKMKMESGGKSNRGVKEGRRGRRERGTPWPWRHRS
jgi:hypothetical protein